MPYKKCDVSHFFFRIVYLPLGFGQKELSFWLYFCDFVLPSLQWGHSVHVEFSSVRFVFFFFLDFFSLIFLFCWIFAFIFSLFFSFFFLKWLPGTGCCCDYHYICKITNYLLLFCRLHYAQLLAASFSSYFL